MSYTNSQSRLAVSFNPAKVRIADIKLAIARRAIPPCRWRQNEMWRRKRNALPNGRTASAAALFWRSFLQHPCSISPWPYGGLPSAPFLNPMHHAFAFALCQLILTLPILYAGRSFYSKGIKAVLHGSPNMDTLVAIGSAAAFLYSVYSVVMVWRGKIGAVHELYFESAGIIITFILLGRMLESRSKSKTSEAIYRLMELAPKRRS